MGDILVGEGQEGRRGREDALSYLSDRGYDIGSSGRNGYKSERTTPSETTQEPVADRDSQFPFGEIRPINGPAEKTAHLQQVAEETHVERLTHLERYRVACRLLAIGTWDAARNWFREQYGPEFDPNVTYNKLRSIVKQYPEDYTHVTVPSSPTT